MTHFKDHKKPLLITATLPLGGSEAHRRGGLSFGSSQWSKRPIVFNLKLHKIIAYPLKRTVTLFPALPSPSPRLRPSQREGGILFGYTELEASH